MNDYQLKPSGTDPAHIQAYVRLLSSVFTGTGKYTAEFLNWQYVLNPDGRVLGFDAWLGDILAAHYVTIPLTATINNQTVRGLLSLNTATDPEHQGKKLFTKLAEETYKRAADEGYKFVVGVANANSTPGFLNKLGFSLITPLDVKLGLGYFQTHEQSGYSLFRPNWNAEKLAWRLTKPRNNYTVSHNEGRHYVFAPTGVAGIQAQMGCFSQSLAVDLPERRSLQPLKLWIGHDPQNKQSSKYVMLPGRFKPSPLNLIYLPLTGTEVPASESIQFSLMDFDAY